MSTNKVKVVLAGGHGGFCLSDRAIAALGYGNEHFRTLSSRMDPQLVAVVEQLGRGASVNHGGGHFLYVVEISGGRHYALRDYDGEESLLCSDSPIYAGDGTWQISEYV